MSLWWIGVKLRPAHPGARMGCSIPAGGIV